MASRPKRPRDFAQLAKLVVDIATGRAQDTTSMAETPRVAAGRKGGIIGGKARASALPPRKRREIARKAAKARWKLSR